MPPSFCKYARPVLKLDLFNRNTSRLLTTTTPTTTTYTATMSTKILAVFGATGQQGRSVIDAVLNDPDLSQLYKIRAITRDPSSAKAQELRKKVDVAQGDLLDKSSIQEALKGVNYVFAMTPPAFGPGAFDTEYNGGKDVADAAVAAGSEYIILSSLPNVTEISKGKYTKVTGFDAKAKVEEYIRTLPIKSAFFLPGSFMQNFQSIMAPRKLDDGTYAIARHVSPKTQLPLIDTVDDTGKFVGAILAAPDKYQGKAMCAATALYTMEDIARIIGEKSGKTVVYKQIPVEVFRKNLPPWGDVLVEMMNYQQDFGYYGPSSENLVAWAAENARGKVNTFEQYLSNHPLQLA